MKKIFKQLNEILINWAEMMYEYRKNNKTMVICNDSCKNRPNKKLHIRC